MGGTGVIDRFLEVFTSYIDSGFGLLGSEVGFLAATLAAIDLTLAALFWAWGRDEDVIARLVKKTLFIGVFAYLIGNWNSLARIVFDSFAGLGLKASGTGLSAADFLRPGRVAQVGLDAGRPILDSISGLMGFVSFFENFIQIAVLLFAWVVVLLAFFILAIQLFITLIEFKLTTLAGFVLIPFGLFSKTAFLAERVLGNVVSSGVKVLVLAVIVGIGSTLFSQFTCRIGRRSALHRGRHGAGAGLPGAAGARHLRARHRQRHRLGRAAARGRRSGRDRSGCRRPRRRGRRPCRRRRERRSRGGARLRGARRRGGGRLPRRRPVRRDRDGNVRCGQSAPPGRFEPREQLRSGRSRRCRRCTRRAPRLYRATRRLPGRGACGGARPQVMVPRPPLMPSAPAITAAADPPSISPKGAVDVQAFFRALRPYARSRRRPTRRPRRSGMTASARRGCRRGTGG